MFSRGIDVIHQNNFDEDYLLHDAWKEGKVFFRQRLKSGTCKVSCIVKNWLTKIGILHLGLQNVTVYYISEVFFLQKCLILSQNDFCSLVQEPIDDFVHNIFSHLFNFVVSFRLRARRRFSRIWSKTGYGYIAITNRKTDLKSLKITTR